MKKQLYLFFFLLAATPALQAQFLLNFSGVGTMNLSKSFSAFQAEYNTVNAADLANELGVPKLGYGYRGEVAYRIYHLSSSVGMSVFHSGTHATFKNDAKRFIKYDYRMMTINIGGFFEFNNSQVLIDLGMLAGGIEQYSYVQFPNKEISYQAGGISAVNHWLNLGMDFRVGLYHNINDVVSWHTTLSYFHFNGDEEFAPGIGYGGVNRATLTFKGLELAAGISIKLGERIE